MIENENEDTPIAPIFIFMEPGFLKFGIEGSTVFLIQRKHILALRDACNDHIKHYGAFDIYDREVKLD